MSTFFDADGELNASEVRSLPLSTAFFYLALIAHSRGESEEALLLGIRSMVAQEKHCDQLHPEVIGRYWALPDIVRTTGKHHLAFALAARAAHLSRILCPIHPWVFEVFERTGDLARPIDGPTALKYYDIALSVGKEIGVEKVAISKVYHRICDVYRSLKDLPKAVAAAEQAFNEHPSDPANYILTQLRKQLEDASA
jgi:hypothetical protein